MSFPACTGGLHSAWSVSGTLSHTFFIHFAPMPLAAQGWYTLESPPRTRIPESVICEKMFQEKPGGEWWQWDRKRRKSSKGEKSNQVPLSTTSAHFCREGLGGPPIGQGSRGIDTPTLVSIAKGLPQRMSTPRAHSSWDFQAKCVLVVWRPPVW